MFTHSLLQNLHLILGPSEKSSEVLRFGNPVGYAELRRSSPDYDVGDQTLRMIMANIPMNNPQMQKNLKKITQDKITLLRKGYIPLPDSYCLMGTSDPTKERILKPNEVAIVK